MDDLAHLGLNLDSNDEWPVTLPIPVHRNMDVGFLLIAAQKLHPPC